jgi:hypothetical protein
MARYAVLLLAMTGACGGPTSTGGTTTAQPYGYENDDDPGRYHSADCSPGTCKPPQVCLDIATDTTLDVPERTSHSVCVSPDSDLCKADPAACGLAPQQAPCSIDDLKPTSDDDRTILLNIAHRCKPIDQCLLACIRSGCAVGIGGGCFHTCGIRGVPPGQRDAALLREAAKYRAGTHYFCRARETR